MANGSCVINPADVTVIAVVDYGAGNLNSVANALRFLGVQPLVSSDPAALNAADGIILPGVGAFADAMCRLSALGLVDPIRRMAGEGRVPLLGICLGMQLLAEHATEGGACEGLGLLLGRVELIPVNDLPLPHVGWNEVAWTKGSVLGAGIAPGAHFYFDHSYCFLGDEGQVTGRADYGRPLAAAVEAGSIMGAQFHPEKSQTNGLRLIRNFTRVVEASRPARKAAC